MLLVEGEEAAVQLATFLFQYAHLHFASCITKLLDAQSVDLCEGVGAADDNARDAAPDDEVGTGRRLAEVSTGLQADVDGAAAKQLLVAYAGDGIHLGMRTSASAVVALADDAPVAHHHGPYHRVGRSAGFSASGQLDATEHVF